MNIIKMQCNSCGAGLDVDLDNLSAYCPHCGQKLLFDVDQMGVLLAAKEKTKQIELQERTKQIQATEARRRMELQHQYEQEKKKDEQNFGKGIILLMKYLAVFFILMGFSAALVLVPRSFSKLSGKVEMPAAPNDFIGKEYKDTQLMLESAGFTNITITPRYDISASEADKNETVIVVLLNGDTDYEEHDFFAKDVNLEIRYHALK